jgi:molybdenum cofactor guanylyltransferase
MIPIPIYILAGGKSSRMGTDKAMIFYKGKTLLEQVIHTATQVSTQVFLLSNNKEHEYFGYELVPDIIPGYGPASGIDAMLHHSNAVSNIVLCCDMPFVDAYAIQQLYLAHQDNDITVVEHNGLPEPLLGCYSSRIKLGWREIMKTGNYRMSYLLGQFQYKYFPSAELILRNPLALQNINTRSDLENLQ